MNRTLLGISSCLLALSSSVALADLPAGDAEKLDRLVAALRESPARAPGGTPLFPRDLAIVERAESERGTSLSLGGAWATPADPRLAEAVDALRLETFLGALAAYEVRSGVAATVVEGARRYRLGSLSGAKRPAAPRAPRADRLQGASVGAILRPVPKLPKGGALVGKRIAISAGHGWLSDGSGGWYTQRARWDFDGCGDCRGITEDFYNAEMVTRHVLPILQGMGAEVVLVREADPSVEPAVEVDDGDAGYSETGAWQDGTAAGGNGGDYRASAAGSGGEAAFAATLARPGARHVSVRWLQGTNRTSALATVHHAGGATEFALDQMLYGELWLDLGSFWFGLDQARLTLANAGTGYLVADAVKFGGGIFAGSGKPWWQMAAASYVPWAGADAAVTALGDVTIRPAYAEMIGADAYLSMHGNASGVAGGSAANGLSTYRYSCQTYADYSSSDSATGCDDPPGSRALTDSVHAKILARIRGDWDANFRDRGRLVANFGELRVLDDTPGALVETAFFDNLANPSGTPPPKFPDNRSMHDPRWRDAVAYGLADGLAAYFDSTKHAPPPRPDGLRAINQADGTLRVSWSAVAGAEGYLLYVLASPDVGKGRERAFDAGRFVAATELVLGKPDLAPRATYAFRVAAVDSNGVGFASQAVAARFRATRNLGKPSAEALIVAGYDRRDAWVQEIDNDEAYSVEHAQALAAAGEADVYFDGALDEAVEDGTVPLGGYRLVDYEAGKDSREHHSVSQPMQALLTAYLAAGTGALLLSGEEIGYDLVSQGDAADAAFAAGLGLGFAADDADAFTFAAVAGGPFDGLGSFSFDDGTKGVYEVRYPDVLAAVAGVSTAAMTYPSGGAAALAGPKTLVFGVPLETVVPDSARASLFGKAVAYLAPGIAAGDTDLDGASDACEEQFGFDPFDGADGAQDADGDGATNAAECQAGTDPRHQPGEDAGLPDAASADAAPAAADSSVEAPDVGPLAVDAGSGPPDARAPDVGPQIGFGYLERMDESGCGCAAGPAAGPGLAPWMLVAAVGALGLRAGRRRRSGRG